ncbi:MAG: HPr kinase/phosphorylase [Gemmatimonadaceae bacterium]|nr:HPr kinase/phosphorylase [Gemmatimonadaceae bacterium]
MTTVLTVGRLCERLKDTLELEQIGEATGLDRLVTSPEVSSPGLVLAGYVDRFVPDRCQVLGETEISYLASLEAARRREVLHVFLALPLPCCFITKGQEPPPDLLALAAEAGMPVFRSPLKTNEFYRRIKPAMEDEFAPRTTLHGSLADVYGVGLLLQGQSGIGKSECVLDLVERGHRFVADDVVIAMRRGNDVLIGKPHELQRHYMEIRGVGLVDDLETTAILGVDVPRIKVPLVPGKNITVILEVIAMNHLLRYSGVNAAEEFNKRLVQHMKSRDGSARPRAEVQRYLQEDDE